MNTSILPFQNDDKTKNHFYALVDCALVKGFYDELTKQSNVRYKSLLSGTMDEGAVKVGPVLILLESNNESEVTTERLLTIQQKGIMPIWLTTTIGFTSLFNTLRSLLYIENTDGSQYFFRYYNVVYLPSFLSLAYASPYYAHVMQQIKWAIWQPEDVSYHYYDKNNVKGLL